MIDVDVLVLGAGPAGEAGAMNASKIEATLGWTPVETFETGLAKTVDWFLANESWWQRVRSGAYQGERIGTL